MREIRLSQDVSSVCRDLLSQVQGEIFHPSPQKLALDKCRVFEGWCSDRYFQVSVALCFLQDLLDNGRAFSTVKVYMSAISACHIGLDLRYRLVLCSFSSILFSTSRSASIFRFPCSIVVSGPSGSAVDVYHPGSAFVLFHSASFTVVYSSTSFTMVVFISFGSAEVFSSVISALVVSGSSDSL